MRCAEMDSPISQIEVYPYGRRRTKVKGSAGADAQFKELRCVCVSITDQMYKLMPYSIEFKLFFWK